LGADRYGAFQGGLYPEGHNQRPPFHELVGRALAHSVQPVDANGLPSASGKIGLVGVGMSNASQEWNTFIDLVAQDPAVNPDLVLVHGASGGQTADVMADPNDFYWTTFLPGQVAAAGLTPLQVQVAWVKNAIPRPTEPWPTHAQTLRNYLEEIVRTLKSLFPNLRQTYLSSRTYGGWATVPLNPERVAFESGFAVKWLIEDQIQNKPRLNFLAGNGNVETSWLSWGPYLWSDGMTPRADGLIWRQVDFQIDGTHPTYAGQYKVARLLLQHFRSDPAAAPWFNAGGLRTGFKSEAQLYGEGSSGSQGVPHIYANTLPILPTDNPFTIEVQNVEPFSFGVFILGWEIPDDFVLFEGPINLVPRLMIMRGANAEGLVQLRGQPLPDDQSLAGGLILLQYLAGDSGRASGVAHSRGLRLILGD
jgi:hypothetical protein